MSEIPEHVAPLWESLRRSFQAEKARSLSAVVQYSIEGDGACEFFGTIKDGTYALELGRAASPTITMKIGIDSFKEMLAGRLGMMPAYAKGKLKVSGNLMSALKLAPVFRFG